MSADLKLDAHIKADYRAVHGIWPVVRAAIAAIYNNLWRDATSNETDGFYVQSGETTCSVNTDTAVTFDTEFAAAPRVVAVVSSTNQDARCRVNTIGTTGFNIYLVNETSGSDCAVEWIAVGKIAR